MISERQKQLLWSIVDEYIRAAVPVSSAQLVQKYKLDVSDATVRNECQVLEKTGYLTHPHTSAGRVPTEKGYLAYLDEKSKSENEKSRYNSLLIRKDSQTLAKAYSQRKHSDKREQVKSVAKSLAEISQGAVLVGFSKQDTYYTGLSQLFTQPEFKNLDLVYNIGALVDHLDEVFSSIFDKHPRDVTVKIGLANPFASECSFIGVKLSERSPAKLFGLLGPMRMNYLANVGRVEYVQQLLG